MEEKTGEVVPAAALAERVGWCADLVAGMVVSVLTAHWNAADVAQLASGVDVTGRALPSNAWMALRRLGWNAAPPEGIKVNDRVVRMAQEQAGRTLRSVHWRAGLVAGILKTWPGSPGRRTAAEWAAVRGAIEGGRDLPGSVLKGRTRQILAFLKAEHRLPTDVFELEGVPRVARMLLLAACDGQQATITRDESKPRSALLRLQLPVRPDPKSYRDWSWVAVPMRVPVTVPAAGALHLPTLRVGDGRIYADLAFTHAVPKPARDGHTVALGVDWGLNTLLSAGAVRLGGDGRIRALGAGAQFRAAGVLAKQHRLRRLSEKLHTKADQYERLTDGRERLQKAPDAVLEARHTVLAQELRRVSARRSNLNDALAMAAARWAVDQAIATGATVIYVEDLRSMEAKGMGRSLNTRLSQQVRGAIVQHMRRLAAEVGIALVTVPAANTSKHCPHCLVPLRHCQTPDRPSVPGWKWAVCPNPGCRWQGDRDHGAWQRIAARGLAHQSTTRTDTKTRHTAIPAVVDRFEATAVITTEPKNSREERSKTGPTRGKTPRPAPRRRRAPSPARPPRSPAGQRPEGNAPTGRTRLPRAADRNQAVHDTISIGTRRRHNPRGAALGAGFHFHAHASPPRWVNNLSQPLRPTEVP
ncbi:transposase [Streptomyces glomeratus]|uniref:transposase n=1 Tax=Streptomyces glomeratus TaxID=284452 RepID=UPI001F2CF6A1|nr:transposase [Streptomyces glomeratus]MCF1512396.1 transposase [Streptomyces glomeratus]